MATEVYANELDAHKADKCPIRLVVRCPNQNCYKELPLNQMKVHATTECRKRELKCPQGCGLLMNVKRLARHMSHRCPKRYVECPLQCGARFRAEEEHVSPDAAVRAEARRGSYGRFGRSVAFQARR